MKKLFLLLGLLLSVGFSDLSLAITLDEAKDQGLVGEKIDGYIAAIQPNPTPEIQALVTSTNEGRRRLYADLAQRNNITVEAVGILSAEKLRESAARGHYIQQPDGAWRRKP